MRARLRSLLTLLAKHVAVAWRLGWWLVAHLLPREETRWVFSAHDGQAFEGNPKYLYLYAAQEGGAVDAVWIGTPEVVESLRAAGYCAYERDSLRGRYEVLRAGVVFGSHYIDVPWVYTGGATVVQLWHGNGIKRLGRLRDRDDTSPLSRLLPRFVFWNWEYLVTTAPGEPTARMIECFDLDRSQVLATGYPRTDALFESIQDADVAPETDSYDWIASLADQRTIVSYVPTFRKNYGTDYGTPFGEAGLDFERLDRLCDAEGAALLVKLHPQEEYDPAIADYDHVHVLPQGLDLMPILKHTDVLVTDYSSAYMDFLLLDRPVVFYAYDREAYVEQTGLYFEYEAVTPGPVVETGDGLVETLRRTLRGDDAYRDARADLRERFYAHGDGNASKRLFDSILRAVEADDRMTDVDSDSDETTAEGDSSAARAKRDEEAHATQVGGGN
ncbi:MAG: CDP-glycerol glycerophosphotransferase family protein [Halohasta sp.]